MHLVLVDLRDSEPELTGQQAEDRLHEIGITVNRNAVPFDPRPPMEASGLRIGTPALATRGLQARGLRRGRQDHGQPRSRPNTSRAPGELAERVAAIVERYPLYERRGPGAPHAAAPERPRARRATSRLRCCRGSMAHPTELDALYAFLRCRCRDGAADAARRCAWRGAVGAIDEPRERGLSEKPHAAARRPRDLRRRARRRR